MLQPGLETTLPESKRTQTHAASEIYGIYLLSNESVDGRKKIAYGIITAEVP
jgi:hypothetical protein